MGIALGERPSHNDSCDVYGGACYGEMTQESAPLECYESEAHSECESHDSCLARLSSNDSENPLKLRDSAIKRAPGFKGQKMCCYTQCPSPLHSKKWRVVTKGTSAGARDWAPLVGQTLCDSCYSTFRKHGTFIRSVRTNEGWFRVDSSGSQPSDLSCGDKPKKSPQAVKRQRCNDRPDSESAHKRQDRRPVMVRDSLHENGEEGSPLEPRPSRSRKPSEKMKDMIQPASAKRGRNNKTDIFDSQYAGADVLPIQDTIPESELTYDNTVAHLENDDHFCHNDGMPTEMTPADLACSSSEMCLNTVTLEEMDQTTFEEDLSSASASDEELIDAMLPLSASV